MKKYLNKLKYFQNELNSDTHIAELNKSQKEFCVFLGSLKMLEDGYLSIHEERMILRVKEEITNLKKENPGIDPARLDFDLARIFHEHLKIERSLLNDWGFWRWLSLNYFIEEIRWRWAKKQTEKFELAKAARIVFDHLIGKNKNHRIFPRRLYIIGLRLYDNGYDLLNRISENAKSNSQGGYGDFILNLVDTKLISFNDNVAKNMGRLLLAEQDVKSKETVINSFKRYNGFKSRLICDAPEHVFRREICRN